MKRVWIAPPEFGDFINRSQRRIRVHDGYENHTLFPYTDEPPKRTHPARFLDGFETPQPHVSEGIRRVLLQMRFEPIWYGVG